MESFIISADKKDVEYKNISGIMNQIQNDSLSHNFPNFYLEFPCGILHCTYEQYPKVIYANEWIFKFMGISSSSNDWKDFIKQNVFFMIPAEERHIFRDYINRANKENGPVAIEHNVKNNLGTKVHLKGWIRVIENNKGEKEYVFLYIHLPQEETQLNRKREKAYFNMLKNVYDGIFKIEKQSQIIECLHIKDNMNTFVYFVNGIRVVLNNTLQENYSMMVYKEDREKLRKFFDEIMENTDINKLEEYEITFRTFSNGNMRKFIINTSNIDEQTLLLCCREIIEQQNTKSESVIIDYINSLNDFVSNNSECHFNKIYIYKVVNKKVYLQNDIDENNKNNGETLSEFLEREYISEKEYEIAMADSEVVLSDIHYDTNEKRHLYVMKQNGDNEYFMFLYRFKENNLITKHQTPRVKIHTFGYFDVFVDGKPIVFHSEKSKEMLALMVDRKGSFVGNQYLISCIWGDEPYSDKIQNRCRQTVFRMMETLKQYGIEDIIEKVDGRRRIIPEKVDCDYFEYIKGDKKTGHSFNGSYMSEYSWGETTLSTLLMNK